MPSLRFVTCVLPLVIVALPPSGPAARADTFPGGISRHASVAVALSDSDEVVLALSAAPAAMAAGADVYAWRDGHFIKVRNGSTGVACMVSRDVRVSGVYPMCFDPEGARTLMQEDMMKTELWARGLSNAAVQREVDAAFARGTLRHPEKPAMIYMMSSKQMLVAYQGEVNRPIGAWHPHVMIYLPHASAGQFALGADNEMGPVSVPFSDAGGVQLVVQVPHWADSPTVAEAAGGGSR